MNITAIGIDKNIPGVPSIDMLAHIENNIQNGCIPNLSPINFGVIKLESIKGTNMYNPIVIKYWYGKMKSSKLIAKVTANPIHGPKNGAIEINPENILQTKYSLTPMIFNPIRYINDNIQHISNWLLI